MGSNPNSKTHSQINDTMNHRDKDTHDPEEPLEQDDAIIAVAFKWSLVIFVLAALSVGGVLYFKKPSQTGTTVIDRPPVAPPDLLDQRSDDMPSVRFTNITREAGINFVRYDGGRGEKLLPETMGGGAAFFDYDNDGDQDLLLINATDWPHDTPSPVPHTSALYQNDGHGTFTDVTAGSGLDVPMYGMGVACGDYDGDGRTDVYITSVGRNHLFRNTGTRFEDVTDQAHVAGSDDDWSTSTGFLDFDNDGDLDLFVCNYVRWTRAIDLQLNFTLNGTDRAFGPPTQYEGAVSTLYRNNGDGTFADITGPAGLDVRNPATNKPMGKALAVTFADIDLDGWLDIIVANDTIQNFVFRNVNGQRFDEVGSASGIAFDSMGNATGAMGMDASHVFPDDRLAIAIANFANESSSLFVQQPRSRWQFADMAGAEGIGSPSRLKLSFGLYFFDYDLDGRLDLLQANGHLEEEISSIQSSQSYRQSAQLFWNCGPDARACFAAVSEEATGALARPIVGRGSTFADIDGDGDLDVLFMQSVGPPILLRNDQQLNHHWIRLNLVGANGNRGAIGARVEVVAGDLTLTRVVMPTRSYLSQVERPITFGLGTRSTVDSVGITWPDGQVQTLTDVVIDASATIEQTTGS